MYREALVGVEGLELPCPDRGGDARGWFVFVVQLPGGVDRAAVIQALASAGIQSKPYLPAIHLMSFYAERFGYGAGAYPICEGVAERSLALPFFPEMGAGQVGRVGEALRGALQGN
jgi:perosamine synthetase